MSGVRRAYLDPGVGEARAVVTLDGLAERIWLRREGDCTPRLGAVYAARVLQVSARMGLARLDLGDGVAGSLRLRPGDAVHEGLALSAEVVAEPRQDKPAVLRQIGPTPAAPAPTSPPSPAAPGCISPAPDLEALLRRFAPDAEVVFGEDAQETADRAEEAALASVANLPRGATLTIQPTRALVAVDVDFGAQGLAGPVAAANREAIAHAARLLRLKALGGLAAVDLIGFPKDGRRLQAVAELAFAADGPETVIEPPGRFGVLLVSRPHREQPLHEQLLEAAGGPSLAAAAARLVRAMQRQARFTPGARIVADCPPDLATAADAWVGRLGPRFSVRAHPGASRESPDIRVL